MAADRRRSPASTLDAIAERARVVVTTVSPFSSTSYHSSLPTPPLEPIRRPDRRGDLHPGKNQPPSQTGHRHRRPHRAFVRIRFHPFGSHRLRPVQPRAARPGRPAQRHQHVVRSFAGGVSRRHRRLDAGAHAHGLHQSRGQAVDERPLHADARPRAEPELGARRSRWRRGGEIAPELKGYWAGAFVMAAANTRFVRRSNALLDYAYGRRFEYAEQ